MRDYEEKNCFPYHQPYSEESPYFRNKLNYKASYPPDEEFCYLSTPTTSTYINLTDDKYPPPSAHFFEIAQSPPTWSYYFPEDWPVDPAKLEPWLLRRHFIKTLADFDLDNMLLPVTLREYQKKAIQAAYHYFSSTQEMSGYFRVPTGGGKTLIMLTLAYIFKKKTLILVPSNLLVDQIMAVATQLFGQHVPIFRFDGKRKSAFCGEITESRDIFFLCISTYQTMMNRKSKELNKSFIPIKSILKKFPLVLADEYHHLMVSDLISAETELAAWARLVKEFKALLIGFTATPKSLVQHIDTQQLIYEVTIDELIQKKFLSPLIISHLTIAMERVLAPPKDTLIDEYFRTATTKLNAVICDLLENGKTPSRESIIRSDGNSKRILIYCSRILHVKEITNAINLYFGRKIANYIIRNTSVNDRQDIFSYFKSGECPVLIGCKALIEGLDLPHIEIVINLSPTRSITMATQRLGRALRISDKKKYAWFIDVTYKNKSFQILASSVLNNNLMVGPNDFFEEAKKFQKEDVTRSLENVKYRISYSGRPKERKSHSKKMANLHRASIFSSKDIPDPEPPLQKKLSISKFF